MDKVNIIEFIETCKEEEYLYIKEAVLTCILQRSLIKNATAASSVGRHGFITSDKGAIIGVTI